MKQTLLYLIGKCVLLDKNAPRDAHSRDRKYVAYATALGASISQAICFLIYLTGNYVMSDSSYISMI